MKGYLQALISMFFILGLAVPPIYAHNIDFELKLAKVMVKALLLIDIMDELCADSWHPEQEQICKEYYIEQQENIDELRSYEFWFIDYEQYREDWIDSIECGNLIRQWESMKDEALQVTNPTVRKVL